MKTPSSEAPVLLIGPPDSPIPGLLKELGVALIHAGSDPRECLDRAVSTKASRVVLRLDGPIDKAAGFLRELRDRNPTPVLLVYPPELRGEAEELLGEGADETLPLGASAGELSEALRLCAVRFREVHSLRRLVDDLRRANTRMTNQLEAARRFEGPESFLQSALEQSQERYRRILENLAHDHFFYLHDPTGRLTFVSPSITDILGYTREEYREYWRAFITRHPANLQALRARRRALRGREQPPFEIEVFHKDGSFHWLEIREIPVPGVNGEGWTIEGVAHDITLRKAAEEALKRERNLFFAGPVVVLTYLAQEELPLEYVSPNITQLGFSARELTRRRASFLDLLSTDERARFRRHIEQHGGAGAPWFETDFRVTRGDGLERWFYNFTVVARRTDGTISHYDAYLLDITERKRAEENMMRYAERMELIHQVETDILNARTPQAIAEAALRQIRNLVPCLGASILVFERENKVARVLAEDRDSFRRFGGMEPLPLDIPPLQRVLANEVDIIRDLDVPAPTDPLRKFLSIEGARCCLTVPLGAHDGVIGSLILSTDRVEGFSEENIEVAREVVNSLALAIQQAQLLEQTRRDAETKTTLLREVNHRVKNNLVAIMGMLSAEKRRAKRDEFPDLTAILDGLSRRVEGLSILHHLLSDSEWKPLLLCELTERIIQAVMRGSPARGQVRIEVQRALLLVTPAVANHFALVVNELATNVLKHALPTREKILVDVRIAARGDDVHFEFCDNGPGFPDEALLRQANPSSLGFDLIRRVVTGNLNGSLRMRNDGGARTEIRFRNEIWKEAI